MGISDTLIFPEYLDVLRDVRAETVAFLGFRGENAFTRHIPGVERDFFDIVLGNWNINDDWTLPRSYDLIISTRCPYFAQRPVDFISRCNAHLNRPGVLFLDWGLGDHWRFGSFKVGWVRDGEHEYAYSLDNKLHSCLWRDEFADEPEVKKFWDVIRGKHGYAIDARISDVVRDEIPAIVDYGFDSIRFKMLWPDNPQLYIMTLSTLK